MATQLKIETIVNLVDSVNPSIVNKVLSNVNTITCTSREFGVQYMPANTTNVALAENVEYVYIFSPMPIQIVISEHESGNNIATLTTQQFSYQNKDLAIDVIISNNNSEAFEVEYVTAVIE